MESLKTILEKSYQYLESGLEEKFEEVKDSFENEITQLNQENRELKEEITQLKDEINQLKNETDQMENKIGQLEDDQENYQKFSILQNFNKQINERDIEIKAYESKLRIAHGQIRQMALKLEEMRTEFNQPLKTQEELKEERLALEKEQHEPIPEEEQKEDSEEEKEESEEEESEEEIEYIKKKLKSKYYYVSDEDPKQIYEILANQDVGNCVGYYRSDGKAILKKKK